MASIQSNLLAQGFWLDSAEPNLDITWLRSWRKAAVSATLWVYYDQQRLLTKLAELEREVSSLKAEFDRIRAQTDREIRIRDLSIDEAKEEIAQYFRQHHGQKISYEELIEEVGLHPLLVVQACEELEKEGKIGQAI